MSPFVTMVPFRAAVQLAWGKTLLAVPSPSSISPQKVSRKLRAAFSKSLVWIGVVAVVFLGSGIVLGLEYVLAIPLISNTPMRNDCIVSRGWSRKDSSLQTLTGPERALTGVRIENQTHRAELRHRVHCPHCPLGGHRAVRASPDAKMKHATFHAFTCPVVTKPFHV